jgi:dTDP-6-deoxy-L-talose 4-dehydrogenase (NAD+)
MRILVTGATGFLGRHVIPTLLQRGHAVIATAVESQEIAMRSPWLSQCTYVQYDLSHRDSSVFLRMGKPDTLLHLAWQGLPHYTELYHIEQNLWSNYYFIKDMVCGGLRDLTVTGTCFEYGMREGCLDESMEPQPAIAYAVAKDSLRRFLDMLRVHMPFACRWLRLFYVYGPGQAAGALLSQLQAAVDRGDTTFNMSRGEQVRDYLPVETMAHYIAVCAIQTGTCAVINCCSGEPITVRALVERYLVERHAHMGLNLGYYPYPAHEAMAFWGDPTRLRKILVKDQALSV